MILFLISVLWNQRCRETPWFIIIRGLYEAFIPLKVSATINILNHTPLFSTSPIKLIVYLPSIFVDE
jgi:hypothetical protein